MKEYSLLAFASVPVAIALDVLLGTRLLRRREFWIFLAVMYGFMLVVNGYLTARPIVLYNPAHMLGVRLGTIPLEDFFYGFSFMISVIALWEWSRSPRRLYRLERQQMFPLPLHEVFRFFEEPANLSRITPPDLGFTIVEDQRVVMKEGAVINYTIRWFFFRLRWRTVITRYEPPYVFADEQVNGPYKVWRHTHRFMPVPGGTAMSDVVEYALPLGVLGRLVHALLVRRQLQAIFDYRRLMVEKILLNEYVGREE